MGKDWMFRKLVPAVLVVIALSTSSLAQTDLAKRVDDALNDVKEKRFEKVSELRELGERVFPFLGRYANDPNEGVRREIVALLRVQTSSGALELLGQFLTDQVRDIADRSLNTIHSEYTCAQIKASQSSKSGLKEYLARKPNSATAILLLSCLSDEPKAVKLITEKRKEKGAHEDGGIHYGSPFNLSVEMALAAAGDAEAVAKVIAYIREGDVGNLFFVLDNIKFVQSKELLLALVELLKDRRPVYEPISHSDFELRVCDLALTALTSTDPTLITSNYDKLRWYSDQELKLAYPELKARLAKDK